MPRLTHRERRVLMAIPHLWPDGDSHDLKIAGMDHEAISYALQHLIGLKLVGATMYDSGHPLAPYYRDVELTTVGEELRRDIGRPVVLRFLGSEWKWMVTTLLAVCSMALSIWNYLHATH